MNCVFLFFFLFIFIYGVVIVIVRLVCVKFLSTYLVGICFSLPSSDLRIFASVHFYSLLSFCWERGGWVNR